ncbi:MAG: winged helix-turn-helix domain-containing protein [Candidatus Thorarchaeota archaeon]
MKEMNKDSVEAEETVKKLLKNIRPAFKIWLEVDTPHGPKVLLGEGKSELLQAIVRHRSINAAAEATDMGFRTAWKLLQEIDETVRSLGEEYAVIESQRGGKNGGGTSVTACGVALVQFLEEIEKRVTEALESTNFEKIISSESTTYEIR